MSTNGEKVFPGGSGGKRGALTPEQFSRYHRHLILDEIGEQGQARLLASRVLVVGCGGLGSPCIVYLAAAGVGTLGLVDDDRVDLSNLQRQILHTTARIGLPKVESAAAAVAELNPDVRIHPYMTRLRADNALDIMRGYQVVVVCCDNFPTRYLINDACVMSATPNVAGSIHRFEGQISVFHPGRGPCYRCLFPEPPPPEQPPRGEATGVLGVLPGLIGVIQATETIKLLLGIGEPLIGRFVHYDSLAMTFNEFRVARNPGCAVCGDHPTIRELVDYE